MNRLDLKDPPTAVGGIGTQFEGLSSRRDLKGLCTKSPGSGISLCNLCVLCVSVVCFCSEFINHREHRGSTEKSALVTLGQSYIDAVDCICSSSTKTIGHFFAL